mmetsp:Transcript_68619/g.172899  ORF Transcript_68619/g.172899 Transcript_68619/m.172899 type:complete len:121 (-) Transcript_68619:133-495(-)
MVGRAICNPIGCGHSPLARHFVGDYSTAYGDFHCLGGLETSSPSAPSGKWRWLTLGSLAPGFQAGVTHALPSKAPPPGRSRSLGGTLAQAGRRRKSLRKVACAEASLPSQQPARPNLPPG